MTDDICGSTNTATGEPCQRSSGWGTESEIGPCKDHETKVGRKGKYTEERKERILSAARNGTTKRGCARAGGIDESTLYAWLNKKPKFSKAFKRARAEGEQSLIQDEEVDPEFVLERSYGYTKSQEIEHTSDDMGIAPAFVETDESSTGN
jgi:transposase-like protein